MAKTLTLSEQKHLDILDAASDVFMECGFSDASMDAIAERAGVSKRTVYNHFDSKDALFEAITERMIRRFKEEGRVDYDASRSLEEQLRKIANLQAELETNDKFVAMARMLVAGMLASPGSCRDALRRAKSKEDPLIEWVQAAANDGRLKVDSADIAARMFRSTLESMFFWPGITEVLEVPSGTDRAQILDHAVGMFLAYYSNEKTGKQ